MVPLLDVFSLPLWGRVRVGALAGAEQAKPNYPGCLSVSGP
jgi:hypothetical protein